MKSNKQPSFLNTILLPFTFLSVFLIVYYFIEFKYLYLLINTVPMYELVLLGAHLLAQYIIPSLLFFLFSSLFQDKLLKIINTTWAFISFFLLNIAFIFIINPTLYSLGSTFLSFSVVTIVGLILSRKTTLALKNSIDKKTEYGNKADKSLKGIINFSIPFIYLILLLVPIITLSFTALLSYPLILPILIHEAVMFAVAFPLFVNIIGGLIATVSNIRSILNMILETLLPDQIVQQAIALDKDKAFDIWQFANEVADKIDCKIPDNICLHSSAVIFMEKNGDKCWDGQVKGRTLYIGYPLIQYLSQTELKAIMAKEILQFEKSSTVKKRLNRLFDAIMMVMNDTHDLPFLNVPTYMLNPDSNRAFKFRRSNDYFSKYRGLQRFVNIYNITINKLLNLLSYYVLFMLSNYQKFYEQIIDTILIDLYEREVVQNANQKCKEQFIFFSKLNNKIEKLKEIPEYNVQIQQYKEKLLNSFRVTDYETYYVDYKQISSECLKYEYPKKIINLSEYEKRLSKLFVEENDIPLSSHNYY